MSNQVWLNDKMIGTLCANASHGPWHTITPTDDDEKLLNPATCNDALVDRRLSVWTKLREARIPRYEQAKLSPSDFANYLARLNVAETAKQYVRNDADVICFEWKVFQVDLPTYEAIFDMDEFEPS